MSGIKKTKFFCIVFSLFFLSCAKSSSISNDFSGTWCWDKDSEISVFSLAIEKVYNVYKGGYSSVVSRGDFIDDNDNAFSFPVNKKSSVVVKVKADRTEGSALVRLEIKDNVKLDWTVLKSPDGDFLVPEKATLFRCK